MRFLCFVFLTTITALAQPYGRGDRFDLALDDGTKIVGAKILDLAHDRMVISAPDGVRTVKREQVASGTAIKWPAAPVPKPVPVDSPPAGLSSAPSTPVYVRPTPPPQPAPKGIAKPTLQPDLSDLAPYEGERKTSLLATPIKGQCFIVTKGGTNYKLGDVKVSVYYKPEYDHYRKQTGQRSLDYSKAWNPYQEERSNQKDYAESLAVLGAMIDYSHNLKLLIPSSRAFGITDADGRFDFEHKIAEPYVVVARAQRDVGDETEKYEWVIPSSDIPESGQVMLTNRNMN